MASRNDLTFEYNDDPRVAEVAAPSTEITMQDLVDTFRDAEYSWQGNTFKKLLNASGKEDLGGGVQVGITASLQNILLAFAARLTPAETGTVTSNPGSPIAGRDTFIDTAADFVASNVQRGSLVVNFSDQSVADVISVDGTDQLTTRVLVNGIGNTYDVTDVYHVFNIIQCTARAGNLVAVDDLQAVISAILPTAFTQVIVEKSSSATLQETGVSGLTPTESAQLDNIDTTTQSMDVTLDSVDARLATVETTVSSIDATVTLMDGTVTTLRKLMMNRMETNPITGIMIIYDDDDETELLVANIFEDVLAAQLYRGRGLERRNRLTEQFPDSFSHEFGPEFN